MTDLFYESVCVGFFAKEVQKSGLTPMPASLDIRAPDPPVMIDLEVRLSNTISTFTNLTTNRK